MSEQEKKLCDIKIAGHSFQITAPEDQIQVLERARTLLNDQVSRLMTSYPKATLDHALVVSALNLANELMQYQEQSLVSTHAIDMELAQIEKKITQALEE